MFSGVAIVFYKKGRKRGAQDLTAQLPDGKIFAEREGLRKEEEKLNQSPAPLRNQIKELAGKVKALDKKELEHLRQRAMVLEGKFETQEASIEKVRAQDNAAANEEMAQIMLKEALKIREGKSNHVSSIASGMLLGSALAFGVTMVMSVARQ